MKYGDFINTPVRNLSLGQRIRCEIVASLIHKPDILFLDEPTIGLDPVVKENIRNLIKKMNKEYNTTIFLTSHDVGDIEKLCKRVIIINNGQMVLDDSMENLKYHYLNTKIIEAKMNTKLDLNDEDGIKVLKDKEFSDSFIQKAAQLRYSKESDGKYHYEKLLEDKLKDSEFASKFVHFLLDEQDFLNREKSKVKAETTKKMMELVHIIPKEKGSKTTTNPQNLSTADEEFLNEINK